MAEPTATLPRCRPELIIRPWGDQGEYVVKDPVNRSYFKLGEQETFLLQRLDGEADADAICRAFEERFHEPLSHDDLAGFVDMADGQGFLEEGKAKTRRQTLRRQVRNILYWNISLFDPERLLTWMEPRLRFVFTKTFLILSLLVIAAAGATFYSHREEFIHYIPRTWETVLLAWLTIGLATTCHEFAHGLTCKHYGGEVHEIGFMMMLFMPCFYCDVSDAWLMRERSKRLWITFAGTYCDLCLAALAVFLWRLTEPMTLPGAMVSVVVAVCGVRVIFNAIPLLKLDGYYFLSDLLELPNLRANSQDALADHVRWLCWGGPRPERQPRHLTVLLFGLLSFVFSLWFVFWMLLAMWRPMENSWGPAGLVCVVILAWLTLPSFFSGFCKGEVMTMLTRRWKRSLVWLGIVGGVAALFVLVPMHERATGNFRVRPNSRAEVRAPVSGFLKTVHLDEGQQVKPGTAIVCLEIPDLESKIAQKDAEMRETAAKLRLLEAGPRAEELKEQRFKVSRAGQWRDLAEKDLGRRGRALVEEVTRLKELIKQHTAELENAKENLVQAKRLFESRALPLEQVRDAEKRHQVAQSLVNQAQAQLRERQTVGTQDPEDELARREKELADARSQLTLLEAGTRPEEIEAQRAHLHRLTQESKYLHHMKEKLVVVSPLEGTITTPYLREKIGQFFKEGDLICEVENVKYLEVEIHLQEQEITRVSPGQAVDLKARSLPYDTLRAEVDRIAPAARQEKTDAVQATQHTVTVYCRLQDYETPLRPGMTGYARIYCGQRSLGNVFFSRVLRYVRTEFWW